ncbi:MAG: hypothetical protein U9Q82_08225 [Chloroflexota bacterium]|nr:hypothetical protein [Chloroflexota bacterium]
MNLKNYRYGWIFLLLSLLLGAIACGGLGNAAEQAENLEHAAQTAQAIATTGQGLATQAEGYATQISESGLIQTGEALVTEAEESGLISTMQAAITQLPEQSSDVKATIDVVLTQGAYGEAPPDIPIVDGEKEQFFGSDNLVSYTTPLSFQEVLGFYRDQMPDYDWQPGDGTTTETPIYAILYYQNPHQRVTINISDKDNETIVIVIISSK